MKISVVTVFFLLLFSSCKKVYTCECFTTYTYKITSGPNTGQFFTEVIPGTKGPYSEKLKEKQARAACENEQLVVETNFKQGITANGRVPMKNGESVTTSCGLK